MKMKQISDSTIKITIQLEDLEERGMEMADFLVPQEKTEEFFYTILDELEMPESFLDSGMLSFRVTPKPDKLDVFVTKSKIDQHLNFEDFSDLPDMEELSQMSPDEFIKTLEKTISEKSKGDGDAIRHLEAEELADENQLSEEDTPNHPVDTRYIYYIFQFSLAVKTLLQSFNLSVSLNKDFIRTVYHNLCDIIILYNHIKKPQTSY